MKHFIRACLLQSSWITVMRASFAAMLLAACAPLAIGQEAVTPKEELDVTMQIIADPDAKIPDEIVRHIPVPSRKTAERAAASDAPAAEAAAKAQERAKKARELAAEMSQRSNEQTQQAAERREQSRRSAAEERRKNPPKTPSPERPPR
jgi:hypothetical protein